MITKEKLLKTSPHFRKALSIAEKLSTDDLANKFNSLKYEAFGFAAVQIWHMTRDQIWKACLRNDRNWKQEVLECEGATIKEALNLLYGWCIHKGYLSLK